MAEKNYRASTSVEEFYYAVLDGTDTVTGTPQRVKFLQNISIEMPQDIVRAYGDGVTAEMAVSNGDISVTSAFHKIPMEDRAALFGLEKTEGGLYSYGSTDNPPYVACVFAKTREDGSAEWVGLPKGMFMRPGISGSTKTEGVEFTSDEVTAQFMDREVVGFNEEKSVIFGEDAKGSTVARDAVFTAIFGQAYPGAGTPEGV